MNNEDKAKQLYRKYRDTNFAPESAAFNAAMEMAEWKEQQMIEKFMKFLHTECSDARLLHLKDEIIRQKIEKAMREE